MKHTEKISYKKAISLKDKMKGFVDLSHDGCSCSPDLNFQECCNEHDYYYRNSEWVTGVCRKEADAKLKTCIQNKWKLPVIPFLYWGFVRIFGNRFWKQPNDFTEAELLSQYKDKKKREKEFSENYQNFKDELDIYS
jgi:hypothetical protein